MNCSFSQQLPVLNLTFAIEKPVNISLSDYIESISYIPLPTYSECLVDINPKVIVTMNHILITTSEKCLLFDRKSREFIREISHYGKGPGEYRSTYGFFNEHSSMYYFIGWNGNLVKYSLDGIFQGNVKIPGFQDNINTPSVPDSYSYINDTLLVCNFMNITGSETKSLMIFNENGGITALIPNRNIFKNQKYTIVTNELRFYHLNNSLYFQDRYNDTVFKLNQKERIPYFVLNRGNHSPSYESRWWPVDKQKQSELIIQPIYFENSRFISFGFYYIFNKVKYFALFDKTLKSLKITENPLGIKNDLDGFLDLTFNSINDAGELSCLIQPSELIKWIEQNPDKFKKLKPELQKLKEIRLEDNPIIVIAKYKR